MHEYPPKKLSKIEKLYAKKIEIQQDLEFITNFEPIIDFSTEINKMWEKWGKSIGMEDSFNKYKLKENLLNHLKGELEDINKRIEENEKN